MQLLLKNTLFQCLVFRYRTHTLYSGSADRTVKVWSCDSLSFVETLYDSFSFLFFFWPSFWYIISFFLFYNYLLVFSFNDFWCFFFFTISFFKICLLSTYFHSHGHLSTIYGIDALSRERAISVSDDNSARVWKIEEEKQLVYTYDFSFLSYGIIYFFQYSLSSFISVLFYVVCP